VLLAGGGPIAHAAAGRDVADGCDEVPADALAAFENAGSRKESDQPDAWTESRQAVLAQVNK
jgi:hypothetical protein